MFEDLFGQLEDTFSGILESDEFQAVIYVIVAYIVLIWLASAYWAYRSRLPRARRTRGPGCAGLRGRKSTVGTAPTMKA